MAKKHPRIEPLGDQALLIRWADSADVAINRQVHAFARQLHRAALPWLLDCVPAYASLAIFFDAASLPSGEPESVVREQIAAMLSQAESSSDTSVARSVEIPVCYGGAHGPDLEDVARERGLTAAQVIERHSKAEYLVAMLGFAPGFPYLLGLDPALESRRLATPRLHVPAGSVGIGGVQTGIYPNEGPGGWRLIGQTPLPLFDAERDPPTCLLPGDRLRFVPIDPERFQALAKHAQ